MRWRGWIGSIALIVTLVVVAGALAAWKRAADRDADAAAASQPESAETITVAVAAEREHRQTTTAIGTVLAVRSITLRNELAGTVERVALVPGQIVETGMLLVAQDVSVEEAELKTRQAEAALAETLLARVQQMSRTDAASETELDRATAERDVALAEVERARAIIARKTIRAPFRARVGLADVHPGQYLEAGTLLTTLQGVDASAHVDFTVAQHVAAGLRVGETVEVFASTDETRAIPAEIVAIDARVDPATRNAAVRGRIAIDGGNASPTPGASVRVRVPVGPAAKAVAVPVSALRKGPGGDHVFVAEDDAGQTRARVRNVQSGAVIGDEILIHSGLSAGDRVAAAGSFKLRDGGLVAIADRPATAPSQAGQ